MNKAVKRNQIAFRCHGCGTMTVGFLGGIAKLSDMLRLKCECGESALEIKKQDEGKLCLSVPCVYCKSEHRYTIPATMTAREAGVKLPCPFSGIDILFIADEKEMPALIEESERNLSRVLVSFEAEDIEDIQPQDIGEAESSPDPDLFTTLNFLVRELDEEAE